MALRVLSVVLPALLIFTVAVNSATRGTRTAHNHRTHRILGGKPAAERQFPHQAYVVAEKEKGRGSYVGAGTLISRNAVLTSAWCVYGYQKWTIRLGGIHRTQHEDTAWITVSPWALIHPQYNRTAGHAVLAIIYLVRNAPLSDYIKPVALASSLEADTEHLLKDCVISGWGFTSEDNQKYQEVLHWTKVKVIPNEICKEFHPDRKMTDKLCAANENFGGHVGDVGTGLHLRTKYGFKMIGIFIRSYGHNKTRPALYTKVASYIDWIKIKTGN